MRIIYKDISEEFLALMQEAQNNRNKISCINVTRPEMQALLTHTNAKIYFSDYMAPRLNLLKEIDMHKRSLLQQLEYVQTPEERQNIFNKQSELERQIAAIQEEVPAQIIQNGITIKVAMKA